MLQVLFPPVSPVDHTRAGVLRISAPVLAGLLRLPPGLEIAAVYPGDHFGEIDLVIHGALMPAHAPGAVFEAVSIVLTQHVVPDLLAPRGADDAPPNHTVHVTAHFTHAPDVEWTMKPPEPWSAGQLPVRTEGEGLA